MNSIGAWGAFQLGGIIGCSIGIICIWTAALPVFVAVGAAMIIWALAAFAIHAVDAGTAGLNNQLSGAVVRSSTDFVKTTTGKVVTGVAIAGLVTTAAVASINLSKQTSQTAPISTQTDSANNVLAITETSAPSQPLDCAQLNLTPEECANYGYDEFVISSCSWESIGSVAGCSCPSGPAYNINKNFLSFVYNPSSGINSYLKKISTNTYFGEIVQGESNTIIFNQTGFTLINERVGDCRWTYQYTPSK